MNMVMVQWQVDMCVSDHQKWLFLKDGTKAIEIDLFNLDEKFYTKKLKAN